MFNIVLRSALSDEVSQGMVKFFLSLADVFVSYVPYRWFHEKV